MATNTTTEQISRDVESINSNVVEGLDVGSKVDSISLDIDYTIIEHFSKHLYSSPNKAIEELVVNGFDAAATQVHVYLGAPSTPDRVVIWDNGLSMDVQGLKDLWKISNSPKKDVPGRVIALPAGGHRKMIGKFGIGKIASYTLGNLISHVCKRDGSFLIVTIDYAKLLSEADASAPTTGSALAAKKPTRNTSVALAGASDKPAKRRKVKTVDIRTLTESEARGIIESVFVGKVPAGLFELPHWTVAIIGDLKAEADLPPRRLRWILGNSMPLRPDFKVWVQNEEVTTALAKRGTAVDTDFGNADIMKSLEAKWAEAGDLVSGTLRFGSQAGLDKTRPAEKIPYVEFPHIGKVWGHIRQFHKSLINKDDISDPDEERRSYGFFIMVLGRLVNDQDAKLTLRDPSFSTFYRSQYVFHVDQLDEVLLADRERLQRDQLYNNELAVLQRAVYLTTVSWRNTFEKEELRREALSYRLPVHSRDHYMDPMTAYLQNRAPEQQETFNFYEPAFEKRVVGEQQPLSSFSEEDSKLIVNASHPFYQNVSTAAGGGARGQRVMRELELLAISEVLFEGYLFSIGLDRHTISEILRWRDDQLRMIAYSDQESFASIIKNFREASALADGKTFENALAKVLESIGFIVEVDGRRGHKDLLGKASCNTESYKVAFEVKGKKEGQALPNDAAETGGAASHRVKAEADFAVIVTREFAGFKREEYPAILQECSAIDKVIIMEVEALVQLAIAVQLYHYPLDLIKPVFTTLESPEAKLEHIHQLQAPEQTFDFYELVERVWEIHQVKGRGRAVSTYDIWQTFYEEHRTDGGKLETMPYEDFARYLQALDVLGRPAIQYDHQNRVIAVTQAPEHVRELMADRLERLPSKLKQ